MCRMFGSFLGLMTLTYGSALAQSVDKHQFDVTAAGVVANKGPTGFLRADINLGQLPFASRGRVVIQLSNPTNSAIEFNGAFSQCACLKATLGKGVLQSEETIPIEFILETPKQVKQIRQGAVVRLGTKDEPQNRVMVVLEYDIAGVAAFANKFSIDYAPYGKNDYAFRLPLVVSSEIDINQLSLDTSPSLKPVKTQIVTNDGRVFIEGLMPRKELDREVAGELFLTNKQTGYVDTATYIIQSKSAITVAPASIRLLETDDKDVFRGTCIVRLEPTAFPVYGDKLTASVIGANIENADLTVESRELSRFLYRADITVKLAKKSTTSATPRPNEIIWHASAGKETAFTKTGVYFLANPKEINRIGESK